MWNGKDYFTERVKETTSIIREQYLNNNYLCIKVKDLATQRMAATPCNLGYLHCRLALASQLPAGKLKHSSVFHVVRLVILTQFLPIPAPETRFLKNRKTRKMQLCLFQTTSTIQTKGSMQANDRTPS